MNTNVVDNDGEQAQRRWSSAQALASNRIEGHAPTHEFLAECEAVIAGTLTLDQLRAASLARALASNLAAFGGVGGNAGA